MVAVDCYKINLLLLIDFATGNFLINLLLLIDFSAGNFLNDSFRKLPTRVFVLFFCFPNHHLGVHSLPAPFRITL